MRDRMQIVLATQIGFCSGVERSIEIAEQTKNKYKNNVFCLHPLIHNTEIVKKINIPVRAAEEMKEGDTAIISAHGTSPKIVRFLEEKGITVIDATCPFLHNIHKKVNEYTKKGYCILLLGNKDHAEVQGISGWCDGCFQVIEKPQQIDFSISEKFLLISQSTFDSVLFDEYAKKISEIAKNSNKTLEILKSICYTNIYRQLEAEKIASTCETVLIIGDKTSSNTNKLVKIVEKAGAKAHLITSISDLRSVRTENNKALGIVSGASTPKELIMEVFYIMSEEKVIDSVTEEVKEAVTEETIETPVTPAEAPAEEKKEAEEKKITMAEAFKKFGAGPRSYREGMRLKARVITADVTGISVAIENGGKNDSGFIYKDEAEIDGSYDPNNYAPDTVLDVIIIPKKDSGDKNKAINLSKKAYDELKIDDEHVQRILAGEEFTLDRTQEIKGGLLGKIGTYTIFIPASQIRIGYVSNLSEYVNKPLRLKALPAREELDEEGNPKKPRNPKRIVASQRVILEAEKEARDEEFWSKIYVGAIVSGKVKRFADFGAFVSLKYMDGLVHNSDLSWSKRRDIKPADVLEINKVYDFIVLSVDRENSKIGLGYKQLQKKPIEIAQEKYPIGTVVTGKVAKIMKYGVFVELEPGLDGLVHISQIQHGYLENINDASVKEGDIVNVKVMNYDNDKITLSIKETLPINEPAYEEVSDAAADTEGKGKDKKGKKVKEEIDEGPHNFVSGGSTVSLGSIFENLNIVTEDKKDEE